MKDLNKLRARVLAFRREAQFEITLSPSDYKAFEEAVIREGATPTTSFLMYKVKIGDISTIGVREERLEW